MLLHSKNLKIRKENEIFKKQLITFLFQSSNTDIEGMEQYLSRIDECLKNVAQHLPQYHIDGTRNIWILKPGAKSRGRGLFFSETTLNN